MQHNTMSAPRAAHLFLGKEIDNSGVPFQNFLDLVQSFAKENRPYLELYVKNKKTHSLSFSEFAGLTLQYGKTLQEEHQFQPGDRVVVILGNSFSTYAAYSALLLLGVVIVPVDPLEPVHSVEKIYRSSKATAILCPPNQKDRLQNISSNVIPVLEEELQFHLKKPLSPALLSEFKSSTAKTDAVALFYTSGTTGDPKGVVLSFKSLLTNLEATKKVGLLSTESKLISCLPLFHVNAFNFSFFLPLYLKCSIVYQCGFFPSFWSILCEEKATVASLSPPIIRLLVKDARPAALSTDLKYAISASSALFREDLQQFHDKYGAWIRQAYGLSETVNFTLFTPPDLSDETFQQIMFSETLPSAGTPVWGNEVYLLDENGKAISNENTNGELAVRGWNVLKEYYQNPAATAQAFEGDYFHTGDTAYFKTYDGKKFYYLTGRIKEIVKRSGKLIYLAEVDQALKTVGFENACAVGFKNKHTEEEVGLYLVENSGPKNFEASLKSLTELLHPSKIPKVIVEGPEIPRTSVGKIRRKELEKFFQKYFEEKLNSPVWAKKSE